LEAASTSSNTIASAAATVAVPAAVQHKRYERWLWGVVGLAIGAVMVGIISWLLVARPNPAPTASQAVKRMTIKLPDSEALASAKFGPNSIGRTSITLSPDGRLLAYVAIHNGKSQLYLRSLDQFEAKPISGTEGAYDPFFSPDGQQIGFFAENKLKKVSIHGGEPMTLCEIRNPIGASWGENETIVFADTVGLDLSQIPARGGKPQILVNLSEDFIGGFNAQFLYPQFLPGGKAVLFSIWPDVGDPDHFRIGVLSLVTGKWSVLLEGGTTPRYASSGHLVFAHAGGILAVPFDLSRLEITGPAITLVEGVRIEEWGAAQFALSQEGTLVYASGASAYVGKLTWVDRQGTSKPLTASPQPYGSIHLSPDGQRLAVLVMGAANDIYIYEFARATFTRLTMEGYNDVPRWTPDGKRVSYFRRNDPKQYEIVWKFADGRGAEEVLTTSKYAQWPMSWSPDGKLLAFTEWNQEGGDLWILPLEGDRRPQPWLKTKFLEWAATFSPDGKYIAYWSDESGQREVYVRPYASLSGKWQISSNGGDDPIWSRDGRELFYREGTKLMSVAIQTQPEFRAAAPHLMFEGSYLRNINGTEYDVAPDGQHFIMIEEATKQPPITHLNVVLNWFEELKQRVPTKSK
jgi:eukaryotic-like serine/threonine-protein kinase